MLDAYIIDRIRRERDRERNRERPSLRIPVPPPKSEPPYPDKGSNRGGAEIDYEIK